MERVLYSIFLGFGVYSIIYVISFKWLIRSKKALILEIDRIGCYIFAVASLLYFVFWISKLHLEYTSAPSDYEKYALTKRMFGPYWFGFWTKQALYIVIPQIFWIKRIRVNKLLRFTIGLLLLFQIHQIIVVITSQHRDYITSSLGFPFRAIIEDWLIGFGYFAFTVGVVYWIARKIKVGVKN
ncbi:MAG: hypothetical protein ACI8ZN_002164 [Bacteroidia bacterium]|jgi:hypothetical protein